MRKLIRCLALLLPALLLLSCVPANNPEEIREQSLIIGGDSAKIIKGLVS